MLRIGQPDLMGTTREDVAEFVKVASDHTIEVGALPAPRARPPLVVPAPSEDLGLKQFLDTCDTFGRIRALLQPT
jgi:hypothetical protein